MPRRCCCDSNCCATNSCLSFDLTMGGGLPGMTDVPIDGSIEECRFGTQGPFNCPPDNEPIQGLGYVHPCEKVTGYPHWVINFNIEGEYTKDNYTVPGLIQNNDTGECHRFFGSPVQLQVVPFGGAFELVLGNEPLRIPYFVNFEYEIAQPFGEFGDCYLIAYAKFDYFNETAQPVELDFDNCYSRESSFPHTNVANKYSDDFPCWEDAGKPGSTWPAPWGPITAPHISGERITMLPFAWYGLNCATFSSNGGVYVAPYDGSEACLTQSDDPDYEFKDRTYTGFGQSIYEWRINLTASGISNLSNLPPTVLNYANLYGLTNGGTFYLKADIPFFLQNPTFQRYTTGSLQIQSQYVGSTSQPPCPQPTIINNDGMGGHVCNTVWPDNPCGVGNTQGSYGEHEPDILGWRAQLELASTITTIPLHDFSFTLKPCV